MTAEKRTMIAVEDLLALEYECSRCHARYSVSFVRIDRIPHQCPNCAQLWIGETQPSSTQHSDSKVLEFFLQFLQELKRRQYGAVIRFEVAPESKPEVKIEHTTP